tara:strand:+ start:1388 stop:1525 length:138 start_codon:yes stop_codon:yes gene_type:complete
MGVPSNVVILGSEIEKFTLFQKFIRVLIESECTEPHALGIRTVGC